MIEVKPPAICAVCQTNRVAWTKPRVDFCYDCLPGGPLTPPPCNRCGSDGYFNNGLCVACHPRGPLHIETLSGLSRVGCVAKAPVPVLDVSLVEDALRHRRLHLLRPQHHHQLLCV